MPLHPLRAPHPDEERQAARRRSTLREDDEPGTATRAALIRYEQDEDEGCRDATLYAVTTQATPSIVVETRRARRRSTDRRVGEGDRDGRRHQGDEELPVATTRDPHKAVDHPVHPPGS